MGANKKVGVYLRRQELLHRRLGLRAGHLGHHQLELDWLPRGISGRLATPTNDFKMCFFALIFIYFLLNGRNLQSQICMRSFTCC
jgi:hypothetical protein